MEYFADAAVEGENEDDNEEVVAAPVVVGPIAFEGGVVEDGAGVALSA